LVVDDLNLSFESMHDIRQVIKAYVNTRLASDDFVAIIRTTAANDAREQFTTDRKALRAAADRLVWDFRSQHGVSSSSPVKPQIVGTDDPSNFDNVDANRGDYLSAASLDALRTIAVNIRELPGRKSIVFVSEGFPRMFASRLEGGVQWNALTRALDETNRAGVVIYPLDPRGLQTGGLTAEDDPQMRDWGPVSGNMSDEAFSNRVRQEGTKRRGELIGSQESLYFIAYQTGGFAITNTNNLGEGLARIVADQDGYYLLGYEVPTGVPLASWNFEGVRITVRRPHVRLRYRQGVLGTVPH
jgi:VWFA-related protein